MTEEDESEADDFAKETLISTRVFETFAQTQPFSANAIRSFAQKKQYSLWDCCRSDAKRRGLIPFNRLNSLKTKYSSRIHSRHQGVNIIHLSLLLLSKFSLSNLIQSETDKVGTFSNLSIAQEL